jgi:superfamily II DNA or RNA helicase
MSPTSTSISIGDRVAIRDRVWRVRLVAEVTDGRLVVEADALDQDEPRSVKVVAPPEDVLRLPPEDVSFDLRSLDSFHAWSCAHRLLDVTRAQNIGHLSGARFGRVALEPYQLAPVLRLLHRPRPRLLLADDVGLGKTIEAGLAMLEFMARGRASRVLVVTPPGLMEQWREELYEKFHLEFSIIHNAAALAQQQSALPAGVSPWDCLPRIITSVDFLKKEAVRHRGLRKRWDLIVVDEAHSLAESGTPQNPYRTQRTRLGLALREACRGLLLLTATPHNGHEHSFRSLLDLVEPTAATFHGAQENVARRVRACMVRRLKSQIRRRLPDGTEEEVFPPRHVEPIPVRLHGTDLELLRKVAAYCSRTAREASGEGDADLVTFAMQIVKKRALSSRAALARTLEHRLEALHQEESREPPPDRAEIRDLQADLPMSEAAAERTAARIVRSAVPREERRRKAEQRALNAIRKLLKQLTSPDPKVAALVAALEHIRREHPGERVIVFTEYRDTLEAIQSALQAHGNLAGRSVILRGGMSLRQRLRAQEAFESDAARVLLATDAASEGLNLQRRCRRVIHFELPWNPNRLEQRNGRVDRYGQLLEPEIRYLYYPESAEDDVLHALIEKIERMRQDRVATPDILGVVTGLEEFDRGLVTLDAGASDVSERKQGMIAAVERRAEEFVRTLQPLLSLAGADDATAEEEIATASPPMERETELEALVRTLLGPRAIQPNGTAGVYRIETPAVFLGPGVAAVYPSATFRAGLAVRARADEAEFITPHHPLVRAMAAEARRRLAQVYPGDRGLTPRRSAARLVPAAEPPSVLFTFLGSVSGGDGLLEEHLLAVRVALDGRIRGDAEGDLAWLAADSAPGDVPPHRIHSLFEPRFAALREAAATEAERRLAALAVRLRERRMRQADALLAHLEADTADRLAEIAEQERRAPTLAEEASGQQRLGLEGGAAPASFDQRRELVRRQADVRRTEIEEFRRVDQPLAAAPLGALFLVPAEA